ncbi:uracil-DNA glycosylase [Nitzschia inconspicua]|uniref:Uracil-DNA glycosylase n=1 Tax=Nitzschia inconspicua TaxID=303405 RepID=A0A9K3LXD4_9STRA|nr:uracil-DNA glycosylase [Nitzschia inconspicua]
MPEGPEVRTLVDQLQGGIGKRLIDITFQSGRYLLNRPPGFQEFAKTMTPLLKPSHAYQDPQKEGHNVDIIQEWNCKGKFIYIVLDDGLRRVDGVPNTTATGQNEDNHSSDDDYQRSIWITLGMTGRFVNEAAHFQDPSYARWCLELMDPAEAFQSRTKATNKIYYHDQRNFGTVRFSLSKSELQNKLASLGPDVLGGLQRNNRSDSVDALTPDKFLSIVAQQKATLNVCKFLMDQSKLAGVGNYILSEALYRANIDPFASLQELNEAQQIALWEQIQAVAQESYTAQGMTRYKSGTYRTMDGTRGKFEFELQCYGRKTCAKGRPVIQETNGPHQRTIWYVEDQLFMPREFRGHEVASELHQRKRRASTREHPTRAGIIAGHHQSSDSEISFDNLLDGLTDPTWKTALDPYISKSESFGRLQQFLKEEQVSGQTLYPPPQCVFAALNLCPLERTKVVILGQDPYHGPNQGTGLAFSVNHDIAIPPSLRNIFKEAMDDVGIDPPAHGNLESWAHQGVLLLNTVLTVRRGQANSHANQGWEDFTDEVVRILNDRDDKIVFLLWGRPAAQKAGKVVDMDKHVVISTSHPSPLGATKTASPFLNSRCFSRANDALKEVGKEPVDWNVK